MREWNFERGKECFYSVTPRHLVSAEELVALVLEPSDLKHKQFARVLHLEKGTRKLSDPGSSYSEACFILHLVFPCGDNGIWATPLFGTRYDVPFHASPHLFYRVPSELSGNPAATMMEIQGKGFEQFVTQYKALRNGTADLKREYETLFGKSLWLEQIRTASEIAAARTT